MVKIGFPSAFLHADLLTLQYQNSVSLVQMSCLTKGCLLPFGPVKIIMKYISQTNGNLKFIKGDKNPTIFRPNITFWPKIMDGPKNPAQKKINALKSKNPSKVFFSSVF